jgi:hypothetical protein
VSVGRGRMKRTDGVRVGHVAQPSSPAQRFLPFNPGVLSLPFHFKPGGRHSLSSGCCDWVVYEATQKPSGARWPPTTDPMRS